jgi:hypothetical protein
MNPDKRRSLDQRVRQAAEAALSNKKYVSAVDVLVGIGWLAPSNVDAWRQKRIDYLEQAINANLRRVSEAMHLSRSWAMAKELVASETDYVARQPGHPALRFSKSGDTNIEQQYRTHWISPKLEEKARRRLDEKMNRPPELVAIVPLKPDWKCHRCGQGGDLLMMEPSGPCCGQAKREAARRGTLQPRPQALRTPRAFDRAAGIARGAQGAGAWRRGR